MITEAAPAKINLALHVTGQRADGYHLLHSLVAFADLGDVLRFAHGPPGLIVTGPLAAGVPTDDRNLILQAAALFGKDHDPTHITVEKHLPHAAGIGGGSADAAAALRCISTLRGCGLPSTAAVLSLGADVPVCLSKHPQIMAGIGDVLTDAPALPPLHAVLTNPRVSVPTGSVFTGLTQKDNPPMQAPDWQDFGSFIGWLARQRNDLELPAMALVPRIGETLAALRRDGVALARMSGSGATCFGLVDTRATADATAARLQARHPDWWIAPVSILS